MKRVLYKDNIFLLEDNVLYFYEVLYLLEKNEIEVYDEKNNKLDINYFLKDEKIKLYYNIYKYFREKGYHLGTGLKFGGIFRIYEDIKEHSKWVAIPININEKIDIYDFLAKNRVAHSTRKRILYCVKDNNNYIFLEVRWKKL
jgi:tRNA-intron endonuclease